MLQRYIFFLLHQKFKSIFPAELLFNAVPDGADAGGFYVEQEAYVFHIHVNGEADDVPHIHVEYFLVGGEIALFQHVHIQFR